VKTLKTRDIARIDADPHIETMTSSIIERCPVMGICAPFIPEIFPITICEFPRNSGLKESTMPRKKGRTSTGYSLEERPRASGKPHWRVRLWVDDPASGARKLQTVGIYASKTEAQREGARAVELRHRGTLLQPTDITVSELLDLWLEQEMPKTVRPENQEPYRIVVTKHLKPALGSLRVQRLTVQAIESFYGTLIAAGYSSSLIRKCHQRLSSALKLAKRWDWIHENPCEAATAPKLTHKEPEVWTPIDTAKFLEVAATHSMHPYWALAIETGARTSELLGIGWSDFDGERGTITIGRRAVRLLKGTPILKDGAKTSAGRRTIRLTDGILAALTEHQERQCLGPTAASDWVDNDLIFATASGRPVNPSHVRRSFDRLVKRAGVKRLTPHGMRKSHITALVAGGANIKAVAARVGHRDIATTLKTYTALTTAMQDELHQLVETLAAVHHRDGGDTLRG
jgi:integrase